MISMTNYWQRFQDLINCLPQVKTNAEYTRQIQIGRSLTRIGLQIETQGITEIKQVVNHLHNEAVKFNNKIEFKTEETDYEFHLPKITSRESLIFAIVYYQHLKNYRNVEYQGSIWMLRSVVVHSVEEKKKSTAHQSLALFEQIKLYCAQQGIVLADEQLDQTESENPKAYIDWLVKLYAPAPVPKKIDIIPIAPKSELIKPEEAFGLEECKKLEKKLAEWVHQRAELQSKMGTFEQKLNNYNTASKNYYHSRCRWEQLSWLSQCYYWIKSWFFPVDLIQALHTTAQKYVDAEKALHHEINEDELKQITIGQNEDTSSPRDWERYHHQLQYHLKQAQQEYDKIQQHLQQVKLQQQEQKNQALQQQLNNLRAEKQAIMDQYNKILAQQAVEAVSEETTEEKQLLMEESSETIDRESLITSQSPPAEPENESGCYRFFKEYLPSNTTLTHITVGLGAIAMQQLMS